MSNDQYEHDQDNDSADKQQQDSAASPTSTASDDVDGLAYKKPEDLTPEELRLMADTMPGEGPGD